MSRHQITHIRKPDVHSSVDRITHVAYDGYIHQVETVIRLIDAGTDSFYVQRLGEYSDVHVVRPHGRNPYIRKAADSDGEKRDNLLSLPQC